MTWEYKLGTVEEFTELSRNLNCPIDAVEDVSILSKPVTAGNLLMPNALGVHPMEGCDGTSDGHPGELTLRRYKRFAAGGAGLLWAEAIAVVPEGRANPRQLCINESTKDSLAAMIRMMRAAAAESMGPNHNPVIVAQLTHSGRYSKPRGFAEPIIPERDPYRDPLSPESHPDPNRPSRIRGDWPLVTDEYLDELQNAYVKAAQLAFEADFDAVDIKSCHGYLINELLASRNRKGKYGGSFENRTRFVLEVMEKIRNELGDDKPVSARLGIYDAIPYPYGWAVDENNYTKPDLTEPKQLIKLMSDRGVNMINITVANPYYNPHVGRPFNQEIKGGYPEPEHPLTGVKRLIDLTAEIQTEFPDMVFVGTGYSWLRHLFGNVAAASVGGGRVSIVGAGRMAFAYPDYAKDLLSKGKMDRNKVCIGCSGCTQLMRYGQVAGCVVRDSKVYGPILQQGKLNDREYLAQRAETCLECQEPTCQLACPAGIDIPLFIRQFLKGDDKGAYETIRQSNILPEICAWLCPVEQQCQGHCLQNFIGDGPLPIASIQQYLAEEANKNGWSRLSVPAKSTGRKIAVIGGGPGGLAAAAVLLEAGHNITVFDSKDDLGGMIRSVVPPDRQGSALTSEISAIFSSVPEDRLELKTGTELGLDFNLDDIMKEGFDAAFIGIGLPQSIRSSSDELEGLYEALEFLSLGRKRELDMTGKRVAVIGGGNTAMDAAVTAKQNGAKDIYLIYRRSFEEMPAWPAERDRALNLGVHFIILTQQLGYYSEGGKITGIKVCPTRLGMPDASGRRKPEPIKDNAYNLYFDIVVESIGQESADGLEKILPGVEIENGLIRVADDSHQTSRRNVYAGGDIVRGPSTVVAAVADGMRAAREII